MTPAGICRRSARAALEPDGEAAEEASDLQRSRRLTMTADGIPTSTPLSARRGSSKLTTGGGT